MTTKTISYKGALMRNLDRPLDDKYDNKYEEIILSKMQDFDGQQVFCLHSVVKKIGTIIICHEDLFSCSDEDGYTLLPKNSLIGRYYPEENGDNGIIPAKFHSDDQDFSMDGYTCKYTSSSFNGWTSHTRYSDTDMSELKKKFEHVVAFIIKSGYVHQCVFNIRNLRELLPRYLIFKLMDFSDREELLYEPFLLCDKKSNYHNADKKLIKSYSLYKEGKISYRFKKILQ